MRPAALTCARARQKALTARCDGARTLSTDPGLHASGANAVGAHARHAPAARCRPRARTREPKRQGRRAAAQPQSWVRLRGFSDARARACPALCLARRSPVPESPRCAARPPVASVRGAPAGGRSGARERGALAALPEVHEVPPGGRLQGACDRAAEAVATVRCCSGCCHLVCRGLTSRARHRRAPSAPAARSAQCRTRGARRAWPLRGPLTRYRVPLLQLPLAAAAWLAAPCRWARSWR